MNMTKNETPRIWIACLAAYNEGTLHGEWVDVTDYDDLIEAKDRIIASSPAFHPEEWAIFDYEGFYGLDLGEYADFEKIARIAELIETHGEEFAAFAGHVGLEFVTADKFLEDFCGQWASEEQFAEELFDEVYALEGVHEAVRNYIDYEKFARDLFINDYYSVDSTEGGIFVFYRT